MHFTRTLHYACSLSPRYTAHTAALRQHTLHRAYRALRAVRAWGAPSATIRRAGAARTRRTAEGPAPRRATLQTRAARPFALAGVNVTGENVTMAW